VFISLKMVCLHDAALAQWMITIKYWTHGEGMFVDYDTSGDTSLWHDESHGPCRQELFKTCFHEIQSNPNIWYIFNALFLIASLTSLCGSRSHFICSSHSQLQYNWILGHYFQESDGSSVGILEALERWVAIIYKAKELSCWCTDCPGGKLLNMFGICR